MDLWIRSQNREVLTKVNNLVVEEFAEDEYIIKNYPNGSIWNGLGTYKTKERALEVLDEIENVLYNVQMGYEKLSTYKMPKE